MKQLSRVVWNEGMHLAQHHFQAQSRYFEDSVQFALSQLFFQPHGIAGCALDPEALRNGTVALLHARGVMPDGLPFDIPASDVAPEPLRIGDLFSPTRDSHLVLLTIPLYRPEVANVTFNGDRRDRATRFIASAVAVADDTSGRDERSVSLGQKNFRLRLDDEAIDDAVALPIARVRRDGSGHFIYDPDYVPPCLHIGASERLLLLVRRVIEVLEVRGGALSRGRPGSVADFARQEIASFWLLHTINSSAAVLRHYSQVRHVRPEQLYVELARLAGSLCTFALDSDPRTLPAYDHDNPGECFDALERHIRAHLELVAPSGRTVIPLQQTAPSLHSAAITDKRAFGPARWVLGVRSSAPAADVAVRAPQLMKVCSKKFTLELVRRAFPGLTLEYLPTPPAAISPRPDTQYFAIGRAGPCWETLTATAEIGVYVPDALMNPELELIVVVDA